MQRLIIRSTENPADSIVYQLNNIEGGLQSVRGDTLNGEILTELSITADKVVTETLTSRTIHSNAIIARHIDTDTIIARHVKSEELEARHFKANSITANKLASDVGESLDFSSNESINSKVNSIQIGGTNLLPGTSEEESSVDYEFYAYKDLRPIFDKHGLVEYTISVDLKTPVPGSINIYSQNGSGTRYEIGSKTCSVKTTWQRFTHTFTPSLSDLSQSKAMVAFYGTYDTGRFIRLKNFKIEKGNKATDWSPAPEDFSSAISQNATDISARVIKGNVVSEINLNSGSATINANKINLVGAVTVLSSISGNLGTITAGTITGVTLNSVSGSNRISITGTTLSAYYGSNPAITIYNRQMDFFDWESDYGIRGKISSSRDASNTSKRGLFVGGAKDYLSLGASVGSTHSPYIRCDISGMAGRGAGTVHFYKNIFTHSNRMNDSYPITGGFKCSRLYPYIAPSNSGKWFTVDLTNGRFQDAYGCITSNRDGLSTKYRNLTNTSVDVCVSGTGTGYVDVIIFGSFNDA